MHSPSALRLVADPNVPGSQDTGAMAPLSQYEPGSHSKHAVAPLSCMNFPGVQSSHSAPPGSGAWLPGRQSRQTEAFQLPGIGLAFPGAHAWHASLLELPNVGNEPFGYRQRFVAAPGGGAVADRAFNAAQTLEAFWPDCRVARADARSAPSPLR